MNLPPAVDDQHERDFVVSGDTAGISSIPTRLVICCERAFEGEVESAAAGPGHRASPATATPRMPPPAAASVHRGAGGRRVDTRPHIGSRRPRTAGASASSSSARTSPMSRRRCLTSFSRHRCNSVVTTAGTAGGQSRPVRIVMQHRRQRVGHGRLVEGALDRSAFVEHAAKGPDISTFADRLTARLLRAHVRGGPENRRRRRR